MSLGPWQIALIALIVVLLFGAGKIPRLMGDAAKGINAFKRGLKEDSSADKSEKAAADKALRSESGDVVSDSAKKDEAAKG
tara:strand:+ start:195 stop:437 length:243 start_codon:yes stop_codon:yes gene_type:complete